MTSKFAFLLFLVSVVLAVPYSRIGTRLARRCEGCQSKPIDRVLVPVGPNSNVEYSSNWAGAVLEESKRTFNTVTGTITVPIPAGSDGSASAWVGIDGTTCQTAILQTGVDFTISNGQVSYNAWYEWYPDYAYEFSEIDINAGDEIKATVTAYSATSGMAVVENLSTGQSVSKELSSSYSLCGENAEWIVEDYERDNNLVTLANFGTVVFTGATASGSRGIYSPSGATIVDIEQNNQVLTSVSTSLDTVTVQYV